MTRYKLLDAFRGLAALLIVVHHAGTYAMPAALAGGDPGLLARIISRAVIHADIGVLLFFVISGYCIAASADAHKRAGYPLLTFFQRRIRRIYPPYWFAIVFTAVLALLLPHYTRPVVNPWVIGSDLSLGQWCGNLLLFETWRPLLGGPQAMLLLPIAWSLCYEEQFYAITGGLLLTGKHMLRGLHGVTLLCVMAVLMRALWFPDLFQRLFLDGFWLSFAIGFYLFHALQSANPKRFWLRVSLAAGAIIIALAPIARDELPLLLLVAVCFASLLFLLHGDDERLANAPVVRPFMFCGQISYSLYLVHPPIAVLIAQLFWEAGVTGVYTTFFFVTPVAAIASVCVAAVFHYLCERPFLNRPIAKVTARSVP